MGHHAGSLRTDQITERFQLFFGKDPALLDAVQQAARIKPFNTDAMIVSQDDQTRDVFYILDGEADAAIVSRDGDQVWLDSFTKGSLIGEMAALRDAPRSASVIAATPLTVAVFKGSDFIQLIREHGEIGLRLCRIMAKRVENTSRRMNELSTLSSSGRVYAELIRLGQPNGTEGALIIENLPTKTRLAERVNTSRETVSRAFSKLSRLGLVKEIDGTLMITGERRRL